MLQLSWQEVKGNGMGQALDSAQLLKVRHRGR